MRALIVILLILPWVVTAQNQDYAGNYGKPTFNNLITPFITSTELPIVDQPAFDKFLSKLSSRQTAMDEKKFLEYIFAKTHQTYLKRYKEHTTISELFKDGTFNCLTGTILYSSIINYFGIQHHIIETNYHIFILVKTSSGDVLIETTDPVNGFIADSEKIKRRIDLYRNNELTSSTNSGELTYYKYSFSIFNTVKQNELIGLLYYNLSVKSFNDQDLIKAVSLLGQAIERYVSPRIEEFAEILLIAVHESNLKTQEKILCKKELQTIRYKALPVMASLD